MEWSERERKIMKITLGGAVKRYDPLRVILQYNKAMRDVGGPMVVKDVLASFYGKKPLAQNATSDEIYARNILDAEQLTFIGELGAKTFGYDLFSEEKPEGITLAEGEELLAQFWEYTTKKESGVESLPTPGQQDTPVSEKPDVSPIPDGSPLPLPVTT